MSTSFSANQYQNAFESKKLTNWEVPSVYRQRPCARDGYTQVIANDRGHLLGGVPKSEKNPWGDFVGTWDMPKKIPGNCATVETARTLQAQDTLEKESHRSNKVLSGQVKNQNRVALKDPKRKTAALEPSSKEIEGEVQKEAQTAQNVAPNPDIQPEKPAQNIETEEALGQEKS